MYALADCNNFFVSCERLFNPALNNRPVIVLSNNDGCAVSRSNEAKALGIKMGVPLYQIKEIVKKNNVAVFSSNFSLYGDMSHRVHQTLREFSPAIEIYSIDEAFLDLRGMDNYDFDALAKKISFTCHRNTGIPVSVGIAPSKTLAKIASKLCKQYPKLHGGCFLHRPEDIEKVLRKFPVEDVWGIGRKHAKRLINIGITTAYAFTKLPTLWIKSNMGICGLRTLKELQGEPCVDFVEENPAKQQICVSRSFAKEIFDLEELSAQVSLFASMVCEKLRKQKSVCNSVYIFVLTNRHKENVPQQFEGRVITFPVATDNTLTINSAVLKALPALYREGYGYKKAGVVLSEISSNHSVQLSLFDANDSSKEQRLMKVIDSINQKEGDHSVSLASQTLEGIKMNRNHLSPSYTTKWKEILTIKV